MENIIRPKALVIGENGIQLLTQQRALSDTFDCLRSFSIDEARDKIADLTRPIIVVLNDNLDGSKELIQGLADIKGVGILVQKDIEGFLGETTTFRTFDSFDHKEFKPLVDEVFEAAKAEFEGKPNKKLKDFFDILPGTTNKKEID